MPQEPKKRHSRQRQGKRRASISLSAPATIKCSNCEALKLPHIICRNCGYYSGEQVLNLKRNEKSSGPKT